MLRNIFFCRCLVLLTQKFYIAAKSKFPFIFFPKRGFNAIVQGCIHYVSYRGGQRILGGDLKFLEQKKGGYENCLNISGGMLIFCKILSSFCNGFKRWEKKR